MSKTLNNNNQSEMYNIGIDNDYINNDIININNNYIKNDYTNSTYKIEDNIDFFNELYKSLDIEDNNNKTEEDENLCLITKNKLTEYYVELDCGHKFNYEPLFKDIKNHKQKFNAMEGSLNRLSIPEIRCPYCRNKQKKLLPYYKELGLPKVFGVNYIDNNYQEKKPHYLFNICEFLSENENFNSNLPEDLDNCKFKKCLCKGTKILNHSYQEFQDNKNYCWTHKKILFAKYKKQLSDNKKKEKEELKNKQIEEKKQKKQLEKEEKKQVKEQLKKTKTKLKSENVILNFSKENAENVENAENAVNIELCNKLLKNGSNKGNYCGCKIYKENLCKRHYNLENKNIVINNDINNDINNNNNNI